MPQFAAGCEGILAVGGKTPRRSYDRAEQRSPLHLVSAWAKEQRLALEQVTVDSKSNEVMALPRLLAMLTLRRQSGYRRCQAPPASGGPASDSAAWRLRSGVEGQSGALRDDVPLFLDDPATPRPRVLRLAKDLGLLKPASPASALMRHCCRRRATDLVWLRWAK